MLNTKTNTNKNRRLFSAFGKLLDYRNAKAICLSLEVCTGTQTLWGACVGGM